MKCKDHPRYTASRKPMKTMRFPDGCPTCWGVWEHAKTSKNRMAKTVVVELTVEEARRAVLALDRLLHHGNVDATSPALQALFAMLARATGEAQ